MEFSKIEFIKSEESIIPIMRRVWRISREIIPEIFNVSLLWYLILYEIEDFVPGFVTLPFEINLLLRIAIVTGFFTFILHELRDSSVKVRRKRVSRFKDIIFFVALALVSAVLIYFKTITLGSLMLPISILLGLIILLVSFIILLEDE